MRRILHVLLSFFSLLSVSHAQGVATSEFCHAYATNKDYNGVAPVCDDTKVTPSPGPAPATAPHPQAQVKGGISCSSTATFAALTFTVWSDLSCPSPPGHSVLNGVTSAPKLTSGLWTGQSDESYAQDYVNDLDIEVLAGDNDCNSGPFFETLVPLNMSICNEAPPPPPPPPPVCTSCNQCTGICQPAGCASPIVIDVFREGLHLTSFKDGVPFDFNGDGKPLFMAWTDPRYHNGWLVLDRNHNGKIDSVQEMFGVPTLPQVPGMVPSGWAALAVYDQPENGGNGDGVISAADRIYPELLVWIDSNHDGISQPQELHHLADLGITKIDLKYNAVDTYTDKWGNEFEFESFVDVIGRENRRFARHQSFRGPEQIVVEQDQPEDQPEQTPLPNERQAWDVILRAVEMAPANPNPFVNGHLLPKPASQYC